MQSDEKQNFANCQYATTSSFGHYEYQIFIEIGFFSSFAASHLFIKWLISYKYIRSPYVYVYARIINLNHFMDNNLAIALAAHNTLTIAAVN